MSLIDRNFDNYLSSGRSQRDWDKFFRENRDSNDFAGKFRELTCKNIMSKHNPWIIRIYYSFESDVTSDGIRNELVDYKGFHRNHYSRHVIRERNIKSISVPRSLVDFGQHYYRYRKFGAHISNGGTSYTIVVREGLMDLAFTLLDNGNIEDWCYLMQFFIDCERAFYIYHDNNETIGPKTNTGIFPWQIIKPFAMFALKHNVQTMVKSIIGKLATYENLSKSIFYNFTWHMQYSESYETNSRIWSVLEYAIIYIVEQHEDWKWAAKLSLSPQLARYMIRRAIDQRNIPYFNAVHNNSWEIRALAGDDIFKTIEMIDVNLGQNIVQPYAEILSLNATPIIEDECAVTSLNIMSNEELPNIEQEAIKLINDALKREDPEKSEHKKIKYIGSKHFGNLKHREHKYRK